MFKAIFLHENTLLKNYGVSRELKACGFCSRFVRFIRYKAACLKVPQNEATSQLRGSRATRVNRERFRGTPLLCEGSDRTAGHSPTRKC
jgi:hypothetical protein